MRRHRVQSEAVRSLGYDEASRILQVEFTNDGIYDYLRVPPEEVRRLLDGRSIGEYMNRRIKPYYECRKVDLAEA